jgi:hypothetical protein
MLSRPVDRFVRSIDTAKFFLLVVLVLGGCAAPPLSSPPPPNPPLATPPVAAKAPPGPPPGAAQRRTKPIPDRRIDLEGHCQQSEEDGFREDAVLRIRNDIVQELRWRLWVGHRGTCHFELTDFRQTQTHPVIELRTRDGGLCRLLVWQEPGRVTLAHADCSGRCTPGIEASAWPVSFDSTNGGCSAR